METAKINQGRVSCRNDKSNLTITLTLTSDEMQRLLLEGGEQPKGMFRVVINRKD